MQRLRQMLTALIPNVIPSKVEVGEAWVGLLLQRLRQMCTARIVNTTVLKLELLERGCLG